MLPISTPFLYRSPRRILQSFAVRHKSSHGGGKAVRFAPAATRAQQSMRLAAQTSQAKADIGLLTGTFIMPTGKNLPSLFKSPSLRLLLEKHRLKQRIMDLRDMAVFRYYTGLKLRLFEPRKVAVQLHKDMYTAFAEGDVDTLRLICSDGLLAYFRKRLTVRGGSKVTWTLHKMLSRPKVVSSKAHHYTGININRRQVVVRLHSLQSLAKGSERAEPKEVLEYLVLEKRHDKTLEADWSVWGTTEETTVEKLLEQEKRKGQVLGLS